MIACSFLAEKHLQVASVGSNKAQEHLCGAAWLPCCQVAAYKQSPCQDSR